MLCFDSCHGYYMGVPMIGGGVVVVAGDVLRRLEQRSGELGVSVDEYVDVLLRSQLFVLEGIA
jgi:hypothetical protein